MQKRAAGGVSVKGTFLPSMQMHANDANHNHNYNYNYNYNHNYNYIFNYNFCPAGLRPAMG